MQKFESYGISHWVVIITSLVVLFFAVLFSRKEKVGKAIGYSFGSLLLLNYLCYIVYRIDSNQWHLRYDLPMEFCNWAAVVTIIAACSQKQIFFELSYFWVLAGSFQGVITPDLQYDFPHIYFFIFHIGHAGLVTAVMFLVFGLRLRPRPGSWWQTFKISQIYLILALFFNFTLGGNYGYLMEKPGKGSLLDYMGSWPYYILGFEIIALVFFYILNLPFSQFNRQKAQNS